MKLHNYIVLLPPEVHSSISFFQIYLRSIHSINIPWKASSMLSIVLSMTSLKEWRQRKRCMKSMLKEKRLSLRLKPVGKIKRKLRSKENLLKEKPSLKNLKKDNLKKDSLKLKKVHQQQRRVMKKPKLFLLKILNSESPPLSTQFLWSPSTSPEEVSSKNTSSSSHLCLLSEFSKEMEISTPKKSSISSSEKQIQTHHHFQSL